MPWARHLQAHGASSLVCFLAQQLADKALKALRYAPGEELVIGHSVRQVCQRAAAYETQLLEHLDAWAILDTYDIATCPCAGLTEPRRRRHHSAGGGPA